MSLKRRFSRWSVLIAVSLAPTFSVAAPVAEIAETKGAVSVIKTTGKQFVVSPQSTVEEGDVVVTETNSTAVLVFTDGSKLALRPNSRVGIREYHYAVAEPRQDKGLFSLLAGGFRTVTGAIGKRGNRDAYAVQGVTATIGIRGTEYTARLCKGDCGEAVSQKSVPVARLAGLRGSATILSGNGVKRPALDGMALSEGEQIDTGDDSWAGVVFSDDTRLVLRASSTLVIKHYRYEPAAPDANSFVVKLLKGALRTVTGIVGKRNPPAVKYESVTATIGIRGTAFSSACVARGSAGQGPANRTPTTTCGQGQVTEVHAGRIAMTNQAGSVEIGAGEVLYADGPLSKPGVLSTPLRLPVDESEPQPEMLPLFNSLPAITGGEGLFVLVHDGRIALTQGGQSIEISKGESAFAGADGTTLQKLETSPSFLSRDPQLRTVNFDAFSCTLP